MYKQVYTILLGFVLLASFIHGRSTTHNATVEVNPLDYQPSEDRNTTEGIFDFDEALKLDARRIQRKENNQFAKDMLEAHNRYRKTHCAQPLHLDDNLMKSAQKYAQKIASKNKMVHSGISGIGENLYWMGGDGVQNLKGSQASEGWYNEYKEYDYKNGGFSMKTGHFTQLVWKDTKALGVGIAFTKDKRGAYVVAHYSPAGNFLGRFQQNVSPPNC